MFTRRTLHGRFARGGVQRGVEEFPPAATVFSQGLPVPEAGPAAVTLRVVPTPGIMPPFFDVRARGFKDRADVPAVIDLLDRRVRPLGTESVPLAVAAGRVLAAAVVSRVNVPGFPRAAMDGYAVRATDTF